jgi:hypothetical protein
MSGKRPTDQDRKQAVHLFLSGLARGADAFDLALAIGELHLPDSTFPGEVFMRLPAGALQLIGAGQDDPICYRELLDKYLTECEFKGRKGLPVPAFARQLAAVHEATE